MSLKTFLFGPAEMPVQIHDRVVLELNARIAELERDRDFYRSIVLGEIEPPPPFQPRKARRSAQLLAEDAAAQSFESFDSDWSEDDHMMFNEWCGTQPEARQGVNMRKLWHAKYGSQPPIMVLSV